LMVKNNSSFKDSLMKQKCNSNSKLFTLENNI
jgi:hypothetical protein